MEDSVLKQLKPVLIASAVVCVLLFCLLIFTQTVFSEYY